MKKTYHLIRVANKLANKYAQAQSLKEILENAAGSGEQSQNGIMNFPAQLKNQKANLSIDVTVSNKFMGGLDVEVAPPTVDPPQFAQNYAKLPEQIKKYLKRHIDGFPQIYPGTTTLTWSNKGAESGVASNP